MIRASAPGSSIRFSAPGSSISGLPPRASDAQYYASLNCILLSE